MSVYVKKLFWITAYTYVATLLGLLISSGFAVNGTVDLSLLEKAVVSAIPAALTALLGALGKFFGDPNDPTPAPRP